MADQLQRLPRPSSALEFQESSPIPSSRGINRSNLTLYFSIAAIVLSVVGAGVQLFIFLAGHQQQMAAQAALDNANRELVMVKIQTEKQNARAATFDADLRAQQIRTSKAQEQEAIAAKQHHLQDASLARPQAQSAEYKAALDRVTIGDVEVRRMLGEAMISGAKGSPMRGLGSGDTRLQRGMGTMPGAMPQISLPTRLDAVDPLTNGSNIK